MVPPAPMMGLFSDCSSQLQTAQLGSPSHSQASGSTAEATSVAIMLTFKGILELPVVGAVSQDHRIIQAGRGWKEASSPTSYSKQAQV